MRKPNNHDAKVLIKLEEISRYDESVRTAFDWVREQGQKLASGGLPGPLPDSEDLARYGTRVATFFELVGTLAKHGLIHEDVLFDRWLIYPFWTAMRPFITRQRETISPLLAENFEWVAKRNENWVKIRTLKRKGSHGK